MRRDEPMLDMRLFRNRSFSAGSIALAMLFFAMAGTVFLQAQYLQFVLGYTPLAAGFALVPAAIGMLLGTGAGAHLAAMLGGRIAVAAGTLIAAGGVAVQAAFIDGTSYLPTGVGLLLFGLGAGIAMPAATDLIMATLPPARAGVGSAVNDTVREFGGALGVAVIGSIAATSLRHRQCVASSTASPTLTETDRGLLTDNVGAALHASRHLGAQGDQIATAARACVRRLDERVALGRRRAGGSRRNRCDDATPPPHDAHHHRDIDHRARSAPPPCRHARGRGFNPGGGVRQCDGLICGITPRGRDDVRGRWPRVGRGRGSSRRRSRRGCAPSSG